MFRKWCANFFKSINRGLCDSCPLEKFDKKKAKKY